MTYLSKAACLLAAACSLGACGDPEYWFDVILTQMGGKAETKDPSRPAKYYRDVHDSAPAIIDMHADTLLAPDEGPYLERLLQNPDRDGQVDVPRLIKGNVALQVFAMGSKASIDSLGNALPSITGTYVDADGKEHSRYSYNRDPNVAAYDDPNDTYASEYAGAPRWMPRDVGTYLFRMSGHPCETWYEDGSWDTATWGKTDPCPRFDASRMYIERLLVGAARLRAADAADNRLSLIRTRTDLTSFLAKRALNRNQVAALLSTEGIYFPGDVSTPSGKAKLTSTFNELFTAGFRMYSLTHFIDNDHGGGSSTGMGNALGSQGRDLSATGKAFAELVIAGRGVLDVAHASRATLTSLKQLAHTYQRPLVYSHGGLAGIPIADEAERKKCATDRNLTDAQILEIASTGGVVGVGFATEFVCGTDPSVWARAVRHAVDVIDRSGKRLYDKPTNALLRGVDHVGLGSDFDGGITSYTDVANLNQYTRALTCPNTVFTPSCLEHHFTPAEAHKILGGNTLRVLLATLPAN